MSTLFGVINKDGKVQDTVSINISELPSNDPLAFAYGIAKAQQYQKGQIEHPVNHGCKWTELASEYKRGFLLGYTGILIKEGTKIRKGEEQSLWFLLSKHEIGRVKNGKIVLNEQGSNH